MLGIACVRVVVDYPIIGSERLCGLEPATARMIMNFSSLPFPFLLLAGDFVRLRCLDSVAGGPPPSTTVAPPIPSSHHLL